MKLQTRIILTTLAVFVISMISFSSIIFFDSKANLEKQIESQLISVSKANENIILTYINAQEHKLELIAIQSDLTNDELNEMVSIDNNFYDIFLIGPNGTVIRSSNPTRIGLYFGNRTYFLNTINQSYLGSIYFDDITKEYSIPFSTKFNNGVLVGLVKAQSLSDITSNREGLGKTGENLMAFIDYKGDIVYFGNRLFSDKKIEVLSIQQAKERPIYYAVEKKEGIYLNSKDYRGVEVIAVANYIDAIEVGLVTKIDKTEANEPIIVLQNTMLIVLLIIFILISFTIYLITRPISKEIKDITQKVDAITKGNLDIQLNKSKIKEIMDLINSLNRILASMKLAILRTGISKSEIGIGEAVKAKEEAEIKFKAVYESSYDAIMVLDPETGKFNSGNPATLKMFGAKDEKEFTSKKPDELSPKYQPDGQLSSIKSKKMVEKAMKEESNSFEWLHKRFNGEEFMAKVILKRVKSGDKIYIHATVRDISKEKKIEEKIIRKK